MLLNRANRPPNHKPNVLNSAPWVLAELTTSQNSGSQAYASMTVMSRLSVTE